MTTRPQVATVEADSTPVLEVSVVLPCLNEAETLAACIVKAQEAMRAHGLDGEVIVADNGSTDSSQEIARELGARVVSVPAKGYGSALRGGIEASRGEFVVMADADDSYDLADIDAFIEPLRDGHDLVIGNRFKGGIAPGAMPWTHRWLGTPVLSALGRFFFHVPVGDFNCGMRAFRRTAYTRWDLHTAGMEFASEMLIKATLLGMRVTEVPTRLVPDGRSRPPHLRSWRDGWRHLRFMLLYSPRWLFLFPGLWMLGLGVLGSAWLIGGPRYVGSIAFDINSLLVSAFAALIGYQLVTFAIFTKIFAVREGFHPPSARLNGLFRYFNLEIGLLCGAAAVIVGLALLVVVIAGWRGRGFGTLDPRVSMRQVIPAVVLVFAGVQTIFASFFLSILGIRDVRNRVPGDVG